jgi:hypothetical protein
MSTPAALVCSGGDRARFRRAVAAHFAGRIDAAEERRLRVHLPECPDCRRFYGRALILSGADPRAPGIRERLARGLGLPGARGAGGAGARGSARRRSWWLAPALAGLALVMVKLVAPVTPRPYPDPSARGAGAAAAPGLLVYRIPPHGTPRAIERGPIGGDDELAFAYSNPGAWPYLLVFAVDEHGQVYWYHPAWRIGAPPPAAIRAQAGPGPFELPSATRHALRGRHLVLYAVFARRPLGVEEIERAARATGEGDRLALPGDLQIIRRAVEVQP